MAAKSTIGWTDATWTPIRARVKSDAAAIAEAKGYTSLIQIAAKMAGRVGPHCEKVSPACEHCYSETTNRRCLPVNGTGLPFDRRSRDLVDPFVDEKILVQPLHWRASRKIFVCSQTDLFGEWVTDAMVDRAVAVMLLCDWHTFQILSKRGARMREYFSRLAADFTRYCDIARAAFDLQRLTQVQRRGIFGQPPRFPLSNVALGVTVEDRDRWEQRIPDLEKTPAASRFVSYEPALGPLDLESIDLMKRCGECGDYVKRGWNDCPSCGDSRVFAGGIDCIIAGGESGAGARPMHPDWARQLRDVCAAAGAAFFFKQWGEWAPLTRADGIHEMPFCKYNVETKFGFIHSRKSDIGRRLDGLEHNALPPSWVELLGKRETVVEDEAGDLAVTR